MFLIFHRSESCKLYYFMQSVKIKSNGIIDMSKNCFQNTSTKTSVCSCMLSLRIEKFCIHANIAIFLTLFAYLQMFKNKKINSVSIDPELYC